MPPDEATSSPAESARNGIDLVQLVALTSARRADRAGLPARAAASSTWCRRSARPGAREELDVERLRGLLARVRAHAHELPLLCGFGVSRGAQVRDLRAAGADGVIVGSAAIDALESGGVEGLRELTASLAGAL